MKLKKILKHSNVEINNDSLKQLNNELTRIIKSGNISKEKIAIDGDDDLKVLVENINLLLSKIDSNSSGDVNVKKLDFIADDASKIENSSIDMLNKIQNIETEISDISASMEEMSAAMEMTNETITQVNDNVNSVAIAVEMISGNADVGSEYSRETMDKASSMVEAVKIEQVEAKQNAEILIREMHEQIEKSKKVKEINELTDNILDIASTTNLLSLNARIEAANAGDAGRGFAVVANEIGKLASTSRANANQIKSVSEDVITSVNDLAEKAEYMLDFIENTVMKVYDRLFETSTSYYQDIDELNQMMESFSMESKDVKDNMNSIKESVDSIGISIDESTKGISSVTESSMNLINDISGIKESYQESIEIISDLFVDLNNLKK